MSFITWLKAVSLDYTCTGSPDFPTYAPTTTSAPTISFTPSVNPSFRPTRTPITLRPSAAPITVRPSAAPV